MSTEPEDVETRDIGDAIDIIAAAMDFVEVLNMAGNGFTERRLVNAIATTTIHVNELLLDAKGILYAALDREAKRRLADEYDAAQGRGEVRGSRERTASSPEAVGAADIGLTHKDIHDARREPDE